MPAIAQRLLQYTIFCLALSISAPGYSDSHVDIVPLALTISGKIQIRNDPNQETYHFDQDALLSLPQHEIVTATPWTSVAKFKGILLEDVLARVKARGAYLDIVAYDGYVAHDIPMTDIIAFHPLMAYMKDGIFLKLRNLGPLFLVYPRGMDQNILRTSDYATREIRQIKEIYVK
ncbi:oxidoreductase [Burkholderia sp. MSMB1826]|uniref:oxidoreductase n=1 Tax=Burkholderia sp. MSMB1826 TaxID=1637875 RepID=UPI0009E9F839|nr:oxidoreductase [Burkholderia sp. MSMB1826]